MNEVSYEIASRLFSYDPEKGDLFYKERPIDLYPGRGRAMVNKKFAGKKVTATSESGTRNSVKTYIRVNVFGTQIYGHRLAWLLHYGEMPNEIDHIDGNSLNNRISNLRNVTHSENGKNQKKHSTNTSGNVGVYYRKDTNKWRAIIFQQGKLRHLGTFSDKEDAIKARRDAELAFGFHTNHGL